MFAESGLNIVVVAAFEEGLFRLASIGAAGCYIDDVLGGGGLL